mgnify:CR=1 FL=1
MCPPDQFRYDGFEEHFNGVVVVTMSLATYRYPKVVLAQNLLIIVRTLLALTLRVMNAAFGR